MKTLLKSDPSLKLILYWKMLGCLPKFESLRENIGQIYKLQLKIFLFSEKLRKKIKREAMRLLKHKSFQISKPLVSYVVRKFITN